MDACPPRDVPPCDPIDPGRGFFAAWELVKTWRNGNHRIEAKPLGAYRWLETTAILAEGEALIVGGFFKSVLVTDPLGRVVGRWSATTMAVNRKPGSPPQTMRPPALRVVVDPAGVPADIGTIVAASDPMRAG